MGRWLIAQTGNGPFPTEMLRTMHEPSAVDDYGMGWSPDDNGLLVHSGNLWTYNAIQAIDPKTGYGYAVNFALLLTLPWAWPRWRVSRSSRPGPSG